MGIFYLGLEHIVKSCKGVLHIERILKYDLFDNVLNIFMHFILTTFHSKVKEDTNIKTNIKFHI